MATDLLVIVGATGTQGISVIEHVQKKHPSLAIRGVTRNTSSLASDRLRQQGISVVQGSLDDVDSLAAAFKGATHIFGVTDYWGLLGISFQSGHSDPFSSAADAEVQHGKHLIAAASRSGNDLKHLMFSSLPSPGAVSQGQFVNDHHFEGKAEIERLLRADDILAAKTTFVWAGYYMENLARWAAGGDYVRPKKVAPIIRLEPAGKTGAPVLAVSEYLTFPQLTAAFSRHLGMKIKYRQRPAGELQREFGQFGQVFEDMYGYFDACGYCGDVKVRDAKEIGVQDLMGFEDFIKGQNWDGFVMEGDGDQKP